MSWASVSSPERTWKSCPKSCGYCARRQWTTSWWWWEGLFRRQTGRFRDDHVALLSTISQPLAVVLLRLRAERLQREFVSIASHEIRTPLTALQGFTELMLSGEAPPDVQRDWLNLMNTEATRLATLIEEMLDINRMSDGSIRLKLAPVHVVDIVSRVVRLLDGEDQRVQLIIEHAPTVPCTLA